MKIIISLQTLLGVFLALHSTRLSQSLRLKYNTPDNAITGRIVGGEEVVPHSRPYLVALLIDGKSLCSGSLITPNYVLTAAHCTINASYVDLIFGAHNILIQEPTQLRVTSSVIINHPDFGNTTAHSNDIALIKTPTPIVTNNNIQYVRLPPANAGSYRGTPAALSGWGTTSDSTPNVSSVLREVYVAIMDNDICVEAVNPTSTVIAASNLCTPGGGRIGACNGDSGSPLMVHNTQPGIVSFVPTGSCESEYPTVYTRVSKYIPWIRENSDLIS